LDEDPFLELAVRLAALEEAHALVRAADERDGLVRDVEAPAQEPGQPFEDDPESHLVLRRDEARDVDHSHGNSPTPDPWTIATARSGRGPRGKPTACTGTEP